MYMLTHRRTTHVHVVYTLPRYFAERVKDQELSLQERGFLPPYPTQPATGISEARSPLQPARFDTLTRLMI